MGKALVRRGERAAPGFESIRLRKRAAPMPAQLEHSIILSSRWLSPPLMCETMRPAGFQRTDDAADHDLLHAAVEITLSNRRTDPILVFLWNPSRPRPDFVQAVAETACLERSLE
jgi:hypothetical protein